MANRKVPQLDDDQLSSNNWPAIILCRRSHGSFKNTASMQPSISDLTSPVLLSQAPAWINELPCHVTTGFPSPAEDHIVQRVDLIGWEMTSETNAWHVRYSVKTHDQKILMCKKQLNYGWLQLSDIRTKSTNIETPADASHLLHEFAAEGLVNLVGGRCGTTAEHIGSRTALQTDYKPTKEADGSNCFTISSSWSLLTASGLYSTINECGCLCLSKFAEMTPTDPATSRSTLARSS